MNHRAQGDDSPSCPVPRITRVLSCSVLPFLLGLLGLFAVGCSDDPTIPEVPLEPGIQLLSPVGGEGWHQGHREIAWGYVASDSATVTILLSPDSGESYPTVLATGLAPDTAAKAASSEKTPALRAGVGSLVWDVGDQPEGTTYRIRVELHLGEEMLGSSECARDFSLNRPGDRMRLADVPFAEDALKEAAIATGLTYADEVTKLDVRDAGIVDLGGIGNLTQLEYLILVDNEVEDLSPLRPLRTLWMVSIAGNPLQDLSPLRGLANLNQLYFSQTNVSDLKPLVDLPNLRNLSFGGTPVKDFSPLKEMEQLASLGITEMGLTDMSFFAELTWLGALYVQDNPFDSLDFISGMTGLKTLIIRNTNVTDLSPLAGLTELRRLEIDNLEIADFSPIAGLTNLTSLDMAKTGCRDLDFATNLTNLNRLRISQNEISNLSPLADKTSLADLYISLNQIADVGPLSALVNLNRLDAAQNEIVDVSPLASLTELIHLSLYDNQVNTGVADLVSLIQATQINLRSNNDIPCADLDILVGALGTQVILVPATCVE